MIDDAERRRLLLEWNDTASAYPQRCLHELLAERARVAPDRIAVTSAGEEVSFGELQRRANQLAYRLIELGAGPEVLVGVCLERSIDMLVSLLAVLAAGAAYVPIDPNFPGDRQAFMLEDAHAPVLITSPELASGFVREGLTVLDLAADAAAIASQPEDSPSVACTLEQLAYVIYTSGSTGRPKGVQIPHRALVNFLTTMADTPGMGPDDVLVAVTTLSFDIAGLELYLPLLVGARVEIALSQTVSDPRALAQLLNSSEATVMQATPTTWRMLMGAGWNAPKGFRALCGGEALPATLVDRLLDAGIELWNMYGPTETTIWSTCARVRTKGEPPPIGRPLANTTLYILTDEMEPVPTGEVGELWIGGDGLARGYLGRPELTAERFKPHPFQAPGDARIYRTGDLARYRPDGDVEFLGRVDHQVKVRGYRIELGEIETVLTRHDAVAEAVVVARGTDADAELAAYIITTGESVPTQTLREFAGRTLPSYMVPSTVTVLREFPLTPNGKVDRQALPEPTRARPGGAEFVAARTPIEERLTGIWERELEIRPIGVTDDFFSLGVTSIVAARLFAAIERELGQGLPLGAIFAASTIRSLAESLSHTSQAPRWSSLIPIQATGSQPPIFCIHGGAGTILHLAPLARRLGPNQPFYGLQSRGLYGRDTPLKTVEAMAEHYLGEMREAHPGGPWRLAGYCFGTIVAFEIAQRLVAQGEEVELLVLFNGPSPSWIRQWSWHGNQPGWRARHGVPPAPSAKQRQARRRRDRVERYIRVAGELGHDPARLIRGLRFHAQRSMVGVRLSLGAPLPEEQRETYFLNLHSHAERAYHERPYPGKILVFYGEGLYEEPSLGWEPVARGGIVTIKVPGEHTGNRQAMQEPHVEFVADRLRAHLERVDEPQAAAVGG